MKQKIKEALQIIFALLGLGVAIACFYMAGEAKRNEAAVQTQAIGAGATDKK